MSDTSTSVERSPVGDGGDDASISIGDVAYDPFAPAVMADPLPFYRLLRANRPVCYIEKYDAFVVSRFADVMDAISVLPPNALQTTEQANPGPDIMLNTRYRGAPPPPASMDPLPLASSLSSPYIEESRQAYITPLRPSAVKRMGEEIAALAAGRIRELGARRQFDLAQDYGGFVSSTMMCRLFGMPDELAEEALVLVNSLTVTDPEKGGMDLEATYTALADFILPWVVRRREQGADGAVPLLDGMIHYCPDGRALRDEEVAMQLIGVFAGGIETVPKVSAHGLLELSLQPDQFAAVCADLDENVPKVTEEIIRYCAPAQWFARVAHRDVTIGGQPIRAGQRVIILFGSAARDEDEFENADAFIWNRRIRRVVSFGGGQHHCTGVHLARLEIQHIVREFLRHVKVFRFELDQAVRYPSSFQWGWNSLPITVEEMA